MNKNQYKTSVINERKHIGSKCDCPWKGGTQTSVFLI